MSIKLIHYVKWVILSYSIIYLNILLLASIGFEYQNIYFFLAYVLLSVIVLFDFVLNKKLGMPFDFIMIGILISSALQISNAFINHPILGGIPSLLIIALIVIKFIRLNKTHYDFEEKEKLSFLLTFYLLSFVLVSLSLALKENYLYLLIGFIPLYLMSSFLMISNFKEFYKRQYLIYLSIVSFILVYLTTSLSGSGYNISFQLNYLIPLIIFLLHLIPIHKVCKMEIEASSKKKKKKVKK